MATQHSHAHGDPAETNHDEQGEFPFPLTGGPEESPYLTWLRNHSNYMAARGFLDYLRLAGVLLRGIAINFLIFLPWLLGVSVVLAYAHHWMLKHPFRLTLGAFALAVAWILIFPVMMPLVRIVTYRRSVETGSESSVEQRDRYERSFGALLLAILAFAALESLPWALEYFHDLMQLGRFTWHGGLATVAAVLALLSRADKVLSALGGAKQQAAMVLIGALGLLVPLLVILYATDFLVYGLPPTPLILYSPLIVPVVGVLGIAIAIPLGLWRGAFTRNELLAVVGLLAVASALVVAVIYESRKATTDADESLRTLDVQVTGPIEPLAEQFEHISNTQDMAPEVAALVGAFAAANTEHLAAYKTLSAALEGLEKDGKRPTCDESGDDAAARSFVLSHPRKWLVRVWDCWSHDEQKAEIYRPYFSHALPFVVLAHKLSTQSDERLAPLRRELVGLAHTGLVKLITTSNATKKDDDEVAALLRRVLVEHYLTPSPCPTHQNGPDARTASALLGETRARFKAFVDCSKANRDAAIRKARADLRQSPVTEIVVLLSEEQLFQAVRDKFTDVPGKAATARLAGKHELARLLTTQEMIDLVLPIEESARREHARDEFVTVTHREWFLEEALPPFPEKDEANSMDRTRETARARAGLVPPTPPSEESGRRLAFYFDTRESPPSDVTHEDGVPHEPTVQEVGNAAGVRLAKRALDDFDVRHLAVLAFALDTAADDTGDAIDPDERRTRLNDAYEATAKDRDTSEQLEAFLRLEKQASLQELVTHVFSVAPDPGVATTNPPADSQNGHITLACANHIRAGCPYQWSDDDRYRVVLVGKALGNDTGEIRRLAREALIERALAETDERNERAAILKAFGDVPADRLGNSERARMAMARVWSVSSPATADDLVTSTMFGVHGRLDQGGLADVKEKVTRAVMLPKVIVVSVFAIVIWLACWLSIDVNLTSIHGLYRDRLASAFLVGRDTKGGIGIEDDVDLDEMACYDARSKAPYHLINVALNLQGSRDIGIRDRQSDFFIFSKRYIGGRRTGYCRSETMEQVFPQMSVASAMAVSAAAASPNMGRGTSPLLVMFMTLLNIRLGYWMPNPGLLEERDERRPWWRPHRPDRRRATITAPAHSIPTEIFAAELQDIERRWAQVYSDGSRRTAGSDEGTAGPTVDHGLVGIGISGGGIRSAAFNLGITQALHRRGVFDHVDYMSTVSGGGYLGSSISTLMRAREALASEIAGTVAIVTTPEGQIVKVRGRDETERTYRFASHAVLNVRNEEKISAGTPLLIPRAARGRSQLAGTVAVEATSTGDRIVKVQSAQSDERREYRVSRLDTVVVKTGDRVKAGQDLIRRRDTLGDRFRWRVRPAALLREMLSKLDETQRWVNLSDGGHIENLAAIELLRRRCKYIIIGDGEADPDLHFSGLATLMRCAALDLGIDIRIDLDELRLRNSKEGSNAGAVSGAHWALGTITYPKTETIPQPEMGSLLYLKSSFTEDEHEAIREYRHSNPMFPHQTTADQAFDEAQFEAYRALGQHIAEGALDARKGAGLPATMSFSHFEQWFADLRDHGEGEG